MATKPDFPFLLQPGIHKVSLTELEAIAVTPFPTDAKRQQLFAFLRQWIGELRALNVSAILWLDGSFLTQKPGPGDIDCVLWNPSCSTPLTAPLQTQIFQLLDANILDAQYSLDFYMETPASHELFHREAYWKGLLGFQHDRVTAKGFVEISI
ncbi:DUF6932 family protein [Janthinobacterium sp.]|uniref:DUF6932 family protein n=1 Tax=Janthinobacterium sp. TaxID=1871054 RepID=UPI0028A050A6|nr:hypothetical protein [Janthinobacterium sp.]